MGTLAVNKTQSAPGAQAPSSLPSELTGDSFITLLTAQLRAQDPLSPMDPTQFMAQLVQFNMLQQMIEMKQLLQSAVVPNDGGSGQQTSTNAIPGGK